MDKSSEQFRRKNQVDKFASSYSAGWTISWAGRLMPRLNGLITLIIPHDCEPNPPDSSVCSCLYLSASNHCSVWTLWFEFSESEVFEFCHTQSNSPNIFRVTRFHSPLTSHLAVFSKNKTKKKKKKK